MIVKFLGFDPFIKQLRTDKGWRVEIDVPEEEYKNIKDLPSMQGKILEVQIKIADKQE